MNEQEEQKKGAAKVIITILAVIGLLTAVALAVCFVLKKFKSAISQINDDTVFEPLNEEDLTATEDGSTGIDAEGCSVCAD